MKKISALLFVMLAIQLCGAGQEARLQHLTMKNYWNIVDYMHRLEITDDRLITCSLKEHSYQGCSMNLEYFTVATRKENLLLIIDNTRTKVSFSVTFENNDNHAVTLPVSAKAKLLTKRKLQQAADSAFETIGEAIQKMNEERRQRNAATGNYLTLENYDAICSYITGHNEAKMKDYAIVHAGNLRCETGEIMLTITDTTTGRIFHVLRHRMENSRADTLFNPGDSLNRIFKQLNEFITTQGK
jgi:hypothetical protein